MILIGSTALKHWFPDAREPKDLDYIVPLENKYSDKAHGAELYWIPEFKELYQYCSEFENCYLIAPPNVLLTIKCAHSAWNVHWEKTMFDIGFLQRKGIEPIYPLWNILYKGFERIHGKKKAYLAKSNEDFFKDSVERRYVHDDLHLAMAYGERPLYELIKDDLSKAAVSEKLFLSLSPAEQLKLCREEIYVTALERYMIPKDFKYSRVAAYRGALKLLITSMTKGWFARFLILNYRVLRDADIDYVDKFRNVLEKGEIRLCQ